MYQVRPPERPLQILSTLRFGSSFIGRRSPLPQLSASTIGYIPLLRSSIVAQDQKCNGNQTERMFGGCMEKKKKITAGSYCPRMGGRAATSQVSYIYKLEANVAAGGGGVSH